MVRKREFPIVSSGSMDDLGSRGEKNEEERKKIEEGKNRGGKEEGSRHAQEKRDEIFEKLNAGMSGITACKSPL